MRGLLVIMGAATVIFVLAIAALFTGVLGALTIQVPKNSDSGPSLPLCLLMEPIKRRVHDGLGVGNELPRMPSLECDYY
jgi:hypothetical protein